MKLSQVLHVLNVLVGLAGITTALVAVSQSAETLVWGLSREHLLLCSGLLILISIWIAINTIHHVMIEKE